MSHRHIRCLASTVNHFRFLQSKDNRSVIFRHNKHRSMTDISQSSDSIRSVIKTIFFLAFTARYDVLKRKNNGPGRISLSLAQLFLNSLLSEHLKQAILLIVLGCMYDIQRSFNKNCTWSLVFTFD